MKRLLIALGRAVYCGVSVVILMLWVLIMFWLFLQNPVWGILFIGVGVFVYTFLYWLTEYKIPEKTKVKR